MSPHRTRGAVRPAIALACLAYVLWRPVSAPEVLYPTLALLTAVSLPAVRRPAAWLVAAVGAGAVVVAFMAAVGAARDTPGLGSQALLWAGSLAIWGTWAASLRREDVRRVLATITVVTAALSATIVVFVAASRGLVPDAVPERVLVAQGAGYDGTTAGPAIRFFGLSTLAAAGPLVVAGAIARPHPVLPPRLLLATAAVLSVAASLVAGRRAILVVTVLTPVLYWAVGRALAPRAGSGSVRIHPAIVVASPLAFVAAVAVLGSAAGARVRVVLSDAVSVYLGPAGGSGATSRSDSDGARTTQSSELLAGWAEHPIIGSGLGSVLESGYRRSADRPWLFELQYHQLLFNGGLLGVLLTAVAGVCVLTGLRRAAAARPEHLPVLSVCAVATLGMLLANASNPYLQAVGHGWAVAVTLGVANALGGPGASRGARPVLRRRSLRTRC